MTPDNHYTEQSLRMNSLNKNPSNKPVMIKSGKYTGERGICLGLTSRGLWAVSPDDGGAGFGPGSVLVQEVS